MRRSIPKETVMELQSTPCHGAVVAAAVLDRVAQLSDDWRAARAMHLELEEMGMPRVNLLLVGPDSVTQHVLLLLLPDLHNPITTWCPGEQLVLPPPAVTGTMILYDVGALALDDQFRLLEHLNRASGRPQIVSTSPTPLLPRVHARTFDDSLYYRLNHVCMHSSGEAGRLP
jgi:hypothetical protein